MVKLNTKQKKFAESYAQCGNAAESAKRAYLQGEGDKRKEWGISTVILNKRSNPCPLCAPFVGKVFIDDVWSGGSKDGISNVTGIKYPLLSEAIKQGLYHPNCKDSHTTYFEGISTPPSGSKYTADELDELAEKYKAGQKSKQASSQAERMERMSRFSLDSDNKRAYAARAKQWRKKAAELEKSVAKSGGSGIIKTGSEKAMVINSIETPIEQRNTGKGNPNAVLMFGTKLNNRQKSLLEKLPDFDSRVVISKKSVNMSDLSALTAKTGHEFAMFTKGGKRLIFRGNAYMVNVDIETAKNLQMRAIDGAVILIRG